MTENEPILYPKRVFKDPDADYTKKRRRGYAQTAWSCLKFLVGSPRTPEPLRGFRPFTAHALSPRFFGMNICPSPDPAGDAYQLAVLNEIRPGAMRIDYGTCQDRAPADRLIEKLLEAGHPLTLHLVQDPHEAAKMHDPAAQKKWAGFVRNALDRYGSRIEALEVGSTPNRHSWSGYALSDYADASHIARETLEEWAGDSDDKPLLLGPNISDFAPYFTVGFLDACRKARFDVMSDNLFVDRVGEPEAPDPHVLGKIGRDLVDATMSQKQIWLAAVARRYGIGRSWCTYTHYTLNFGKERVRYVSEEQYANYMVRLHLMSAATGAFERVYWGTLVTNFKGLVDETTRVRPYPPFVHHRFTIDGAPKRWKRRDNFLTTYATLTRQISGARFLGMRNPDKRTFVLEFERGGRHCAVGWTRDGHTARFDARRDGAPPTRVIDREGDEHPVETTLKLTERPVYWVY